MYGLSSSKVKLLTHACMLARQADRPTSTLGTAKNSFFFNLLTFSNGQFKHLLKEPLERQQQHLANTDCTCSSGSGVKSKKDVRILRVAAILLLELSRQTKNTKCMKHVTAVNTVVK